MDRPAAEYDPHLLHERGLRDATAYAIRLEYIDWRAGEIPIRGKGRLHDRMPLPVDVGEAIVDHVRRGRDGTSRSLVLCCKAPYRPFVNGLLRRWW